MQANGSIFCYNKTKNGVILSFLFSYEFIRGNLANRLINLHIDSAILKELTIVTTLGALL